MVFISVGVHSLWSPKARMEIILHSDIHQYLSQTGMYGDCQPLRLVISIGFIGIEITSWIIQPDSTGQEVYSLQLLIWRSSRLLRDRASTKRRASWRSVSRGMP